MKVIEVKISNCLISRLITFAIAVPDTMPFEIIELLHRQFEHFNSDCHVNFYIDSENFICGMPVNMKRDEKNLTYDQYLAKWYKKTNFAETANNTLGTHNDIITEAIICLNLN